MPGLRGCDTLTIVDFIISVYQVIPLLKVVGVGVTNRGDTATQSEQGKKKSNLQFAPEVSPTDQVQTSIR